MTVIDSSAIIPLARIGNLTLLKELPEPKTTQHVHEETVKQGKGKQGTSQIEKAFQDWLKIIKINDETLEETAELEGISKADAAVLKLAEKKTEPLLANDKTLIQVARAQNIECYWVTTLILKQIKQKNITKNKGKKILYNLVKKGMNLKPKVYTAILKKIDNM